VTLVTVSDTKRVTSVTAVARCFLIKLNKRSGFFDGNYILKVLDELLNYRYQ